MEGYNLKIVVEALGDTGDYKYLATSPDLPSLIVAGDTPDEVLGLAPRGVRVDCFDEGSRRQASGYSPRNPIAAIHIRSGSCCMKCAELTRVQRLR